MNHSVLTISQDPDIVTVIERFDVPVEQQQAATVKAQSYIQENWQNEPNFVGVALLKSRDHGGLSSYSQWKRTGSAPRVPDKSQTLAAALPEFKLLDSKCFSLEFSAEAPIVSPPALISLAGSPKAHFGLFTTAVERQNEMVDRARANAPHSLDVPGLLAVNFHRSLDGERVVNLGLWTSFEAFSNLTKQKGFQNDDLYWEGVADFEYDFFDVVAVEAAA